MEFPNKMVIQFDSYLVQTQIQLIINNESGRNTVGANEQTKNSMSDLPKYLRIFDFLTVFLLFKSGTRFVIYKFKIFPTKYESQKIMY